MKRIGLALCIFFMGWSVAGCNLDDGGIELDVNSGEGSCEALECGQHGDCEVENGLARCVCDAGYGGEACGECASGFVLDAHECVEVESCDDQVDYCGDFGACDDTTGLRQCECEEGYQGEQCGECAEGYYLDNDGECALNIPCAETDPCGENGTCQDSVDGVICECDEGYQGLRCRECTADYYQVGETFCAPRQYCGDEVAPCNDRGVCDDATGAIVCECDEAYAGQRCTECDSGFVEVDGACEAPQACEADSCFGNGECDDSSGLVECSCDGGFGPPFCQSCAVGFVGDGCDECAEGYEAVGLECLAICGDGLHVEPEACDDGNTNSVTSTTDFCSSDCSFQNWPDGTWPGYIPPQSGTSWVTWFDAQVNGNDSRYMLLDAGAGLDVSVTYTYDASQTCADCPTQLYLGWFSQDGTNSDPLEGQPQACRNGVTTETRTLSQTMTAPSEPGTYYLRWARGSEVGCQSSMSRPGMNSNLFVIYVQD